MSDVPHPRAHRPARVPLAIGAIGVTVGLFALLHQLLFHGIAQTFDTMIYGRALWGFAHGDGMNPVVGVHALAVHAHWALVLLAPFARVFEPAHVLMAAQSIAAGATFWMVGAACGRIAGEHGLRPAPLAIFGAVVGTAASPFVANPFLLDTRPDVIAVPLLLWAFLRIQRTGDIDRAALCGMAAALLMREEFLMTIGTALIFAPTRVPWRDRAGVRIGGSMLAVAYWAVYWFVLRDYFGGAVATERVSGVGGIFFGDSAATWWATWASAGVYKVEIFVAAVATLGGAAVLGGRWLLVALPGVLFVLMPSRMADVALNFHYPIFAAPALLAAGVAGLERVLDRIDRAPASRARLARSVAAIAACTVALSTFLGSSAVPGGRRFQEAWFYPDRVVESGAGTVAEVHRWLADIPEDQPLGVSYLYGAPLVDRPFITTNAQIRRQLARQGSVAQGLDLIAVTPGHSSGLGEVLTEHFRFAGRVVVGGRLIVFERQSP